MDDLIIDKLERAVTLEDSVLQEIVQQLEQAGCAVNDSILGLSFLLAGGDSLAAVRVIDRIRKEYEAEPPITVFFEQMSILELAKTIAQMIHELRGSHEPVNLPK